MLGPATCRCPRQPNRHLSAFAWVAANGGGSSRLLGKSVNLRQPEPGAAADRLCCEERLERSGPTSSAIPTPVSDTDRPRTRRPVRSDPDCSGKASPWSAVSDRQLPPSGMASRAFRQG